MEEILLFSSELSSELNSRHMYKKSSLKRDQKEKALREEMRGINAVPALLHKSCDETLESLALDKYEILPAEPLHDNAGHTKNLVIVIPELLPKKLKEEFLQVMMVSFRNREEKRAVDYRNLVVDLLSMIGKKLPPTLQLLLSTLAEIQRILMQVTT